MLDFTAEVVEGMQVSVSDGTEGRVQWDGDETRPLVSPSSMVAPGQVVWQFERLESEPVKYICSHVCNLIMLMLLWSLFMSAQPTLASPRLRKTEGVGDARLCQHYGTCHARVPAGAARRGRSRIPNANSTRDLDVVESTWHLLQTNCPSFHSKRSHRLTDRLTTGREATIATSSNRRPKQSRASAPSATWCCASPTKRRAAGTAFVGRASSLFVSATPTAQRVGAQASPPSPTSDWSARSSH